MADLVTDFRYVGTELELFAAATTWKAYVRRQVRPYLGKDVLEVGAGQGGTTRLLCSGAERTWICLEPDAVLAARLEESAASGQLAACCRVVQGTLDDVARQPGFDAVIYIDVLEHIEDDRAELRRAADRLRPGGHLVVLSPAHQWLFTPFDRAIGHFRRYTRRTLAACGPGGVELVRLRYLDSIGMAASLGNRLLLRQGMPTPQQLALWDRVLVRLSRTVDPLLRYSVGKSVLAVWRRP